MRMHPNECDIETITLGKLLDAVKTERLQGTYGKYLKLIKFTVWSGAV